MSKVTTHTSLGCRYNSPGKAKMCWTATRCTAGPPAGYQVTSCDEGVRQHPSSIGLPANWSVQPCWPAAAVEAGTLAAAVTCCTNDEVSQTLTLPPTPFPARPAGQTPRLQSRLNCTELHWAVHTAAEGVCAKRPDCRWKAETLEAALDKCEGLGARLCTLAEVEADDTDQLGCFMDTQLAWTSTRCATAGAGSALDGWQVTLGDDAARRRPEAHGLAAGAVLQACWPDAAVSAAAGAMTAAVRGTEASRYVRLVRAHRYRTRTRTVQ
jgi:hypothetical protein